MISTQVQQFLGEVLRGHRTSDDARFVLRLLDDGPAKEAEFDRVLNTVSQKIPGLAIDFDKLIAGDEIECDPLVSQGNLAILRLDALYYQAFEAWTKSGGDLHKHKSISTPASNELRTDHTLKRERTDQNYPPRRAALKSMHEHRPGRLPSPSHHHAPQRTSKNPQSIQPTG